MKRKTTMILTTIACLAPILLGLALYDQLPDMVPTHFNARWEPDGWSSRPVAVFGLPCLMAALNLLCFWVFSYVETQYKDRKVAPEALMTFCFWIPAVISLTLVPMTLLRAIGKEVPMALFLNVFMGLIFLVAGNYLPKCRMNAFVGIKLPWTYSSEDNWNRTHRLGGFVWVIAGILWLLNAALDLPWLNIVLVTAALVIPGGYSYALYRREKKAKER